MSAATKLGGFLAERAGSILSKKLGAAAVAEALVAEANPALQGVPLIVFIVAQAALDGWRYWVDRRWPSGR